MKEDISSDSDYELIQSNTNLRQGNENENKDVLPENQINVEELKQTLQQMIDELKIENSKQNSVLKEIIEQKDEKIICLENKIKQMEESTDKNVGKLTEELEQINLNNKQLCFVQLANKWKEIKEKVNEAPWFTEDCCEAKCINTENPVGNCVKGNGFVNLIDDENITYIEPKNDERYGYPLGHDKSATIYAENSFEKAKNSSNYSLFYFEVKYISKSNEERINHRSIHVGLENSSKSYASLNFGVYGGKQIHFKVQDRKGQTGHLYLQNILWNNNDILGCGIVYPPSNTNDFTYIFFTHNGKQIGNPILLNENCDGYKPFIQLKSCSVETNFGKDLKANPFVYDLSKHLFHKYSDYEKDLNELIEMFPLIAKEGLEQILLAKGGIKKIVSENLDAIFPKNT
uniref:Uncharacterized protein n=1 Tax=Meloidogyne enterolobii TaxID=390850 RepID=A0A6V7WW82_MELEN|nr:unnamed protein product [Meloidogyne enterolobii]